MCFVYAKQLWMEIVSREQTSEFYGDENQGAGRKG